MTMQTTKEKVSYVIGLETGRNLIQQFGEMDFKYVLEGIQHGISGTDPQLPQEEITSIIEALKQQIQSKQKEFFTQLSEENKKRSETFLLENKKKEGVITLNSGLQYKILERAPKEGPCPTALDTVKIHYRGSYIDGKVFDSSYQREEPLVIGLNQVILGWSEILQKMQIGDKWQVFIPSYLAYGERGFEPHIGPNVALIFEMHLLGINS
ncbi:FKBP-type peptidyl-prolyl cis-trans isomerase [Candidatus Rhabdochlamydia porcellionis]|jgi:FKBP-type peptidyl-prolyl cis-trans isomerase|nr:FKBP-type peptidyl-prolyl cis-trans isomerase [Candidatus Rhabdochlamydia porcellionis]